MKRNRSVLFVGLFMLLLVFGSAFAEDYKPWDELSGDNWIMGFGGGDPNIYPVNAADDADVDYSYPISFQEASSSDDNHDEQTIYKAKGMNALRFFQGGEMNGHFVSRNKSGSFVIANTGDACAYTDILLLIAIDADSLASDFSMTINLAGHVTYTLDAADFVYYDHPGGRPSGFHSPTTPSVEPISYGFDTGMVTVYGVSGLSEDNRLGQVLDKKNPYPYNTITIEYSFSDVPAPVVFSIYGYQSDSVSQDIYHTNRGTIDVNNASKKVSTFAVTVEGDINGDLKVDLEDLAMMAGNWLLGVE